MMFGHFLIDVQADAGIGGVWGEMRVLPSGGPSFLLTPWKPTSAGGKCYTTSTASLAPAEKTQQEEEVHTAGNVIDSDTRRALGFARSSNN
eukprot:1153932-Pelagomonas_calceolata.AAC.2